MKLLGELRIDGANARLRLHQIDVGIQTGDCGPRAVIARFVWKVDRARHPNLGLFREFKSRRHHSDDRNGSRADLDLFADNRGVGSEAALPQSVADDRDAYRLGFVVFGNERSPENRLDTEHREEPARHAGARHALRFGPIGAKVRVTGPECRGAREEIGLLRPIGEIQERDVAVGNPRRRISAFEVDDAFRGRERQRTEENAVDQAEDGGVGADAEPERDHGDGREAFILEKHSDSVTDVLEECAHMD